MREVEVMGVRVEMPSNAPMVLLREVGGSRYLPIWIGANEASAIANAENNHNLDVDSLVVAEASVGKSITMKRFATRGRGKSTRILKPFSRLRIVVREQEEA